MCYILQLKQHYIKDKSPYILENNLLQIEMLLFSANQYVLVLSMH